MVFNAIPFASLLCISTPVEKLFCCLVMAQNLANLGKQGQAEIDYAKLMEESKKQNVYLKNIDQNVVKI